MASRRPKRPVKSDKFPGIEPVFSGGRWMWRARFKKHGAVKVGSLRTTQRAAHKDYLQLQAVNRPSIRRGQPRNLGDALDAALQTKAAGMASERTVRAARAAADSILKVLKPSFPVAALGKAEIEGYISRAIKKRGLHSNTVRDKHLPLLRAAFREAEVEWPRDVTIPRRIKPDMAYFELDELVPLLGRVRAVNPRHADIIELLALTGLRVGELARVRVDDVNLDNATIRVVNCKDGGAIQQVFLPVARKEVLERLSEQSPGILLVGPEGTINTILQRWRQRLEEPRLNGRALRHTFVTGLLALGASPKEVQDRARHTSLATTMRYVHRLEHGSKHLDLLAERLSPGTGSLPPAAAPCSPPASE